MVVITVVMVVKVAMVAIVVPEASGIPETSLMFAAFKIPVALVA